MEQIINELRIWRTSRNIQSGFNIDNEVANMLDECKESLLAITNEHKAEELCDVAIFAFNGLGKMNAKFYNKSTNWSGISNIIRSLSNIVETRRDMETITELNYIVKFCENTVFELGYDFKKMTLEKIKVISSRIQSPNQAREWAENGVSGKWEKSTFPEHIAMVYIPDFESCRVAKA